MARISWIQIALKRTAARLFLPRVAGKRWEEDTDTRVRRLVEKGKSGGTRRSANELHRCLCGSIVTSTRKNGNRPCFFFFFFSKCFELETDEWLLVGQIGLQNRPRWKYSLCLFAILIKYVADNIIRLELYLCNSSFVRSKRDAVSKLLEYD